MNLEQILADLAVKFPWLMVVFLVLGVFRFVFKPAMLAVEVFVKATPSTSDDVKLEGFKAGRVYKSLVWFVDFLLSIKLPQAKPKDVTPAANDLPKAS